jgi:MoxR-like ATPase
MSEKKRFEGSDSYVATDDLRVAVNAAIALERPLLVKGEPGTGKTMLALEVARALGMPIIEWHTSAPSTLRQGQRRQRPRCLVCHIRGARGSSAC